MCANWTNSFDSSRKLTRIIRYRSKFEVRFKQIELWLAAERLLNQTFNPAFNRRGSRP